MYQLIAFDLDGTILNNQGELSENTLKQLNSYLARGYYLVPCSARSLPDYPAWFKNNPAIPYLITHNGALLIDNQTKAVLSKHTLNNQKALEVTKHLAPTTELFTFNFENYMLSTLKLYHFLLPQDTEFKAGMFQFANRLYTQDYRYCLTHLVNDITKIHVSLADPAEKEHLYHLMAEISDVDVSSSYPFNIEVTHPLATKGQALQEVLQRLKLDKTQAIAFGDNDNDLSLLKAVGHPVAMANSTPLLKDFTPNITPATNDQDGVIKYLANLLANNSN